MTDTPYPRTASVATWPPTQVADLLGRATRFDFPFWETEHEYRALRVEWRGPNSSNPSPDQWVITDGHHTWCRDGKWDWEPRNSERDDYHYTMMRWPLADAITQAQALAGAMHADTDRRMRRMMARHLTVRMRRLEARLAARQDTADPSSDTP